MSSDRLRRVVAYDATDNVANALEPLAAGDLVEAFGRKIVVRTSVPLGHKVALGRIEEGELVFKSGEAIGRTRHVIEAGQHVHVHNLVSMFAGDSHVSTDEIAG